MLIRNAICLLLTALVVLSPAPSGAAVRHTHTSHLVARSGTRAQGHSEKDTARVRYIIEKVTSHALTALVQASNKGNGKNLHLNAINAYVAIVRPDFLQVDSIGNVIGRARFGQKNWAGISPITTTAPVPGEPMTLLEATSQITQIRMVSMREALVAGHDSYHWIGTIRRVIKNRQAGGAAAIIPNTEQRYLIYRYRRRWLLGRNGRWEMKSSSTTLLKQAVTL